MRLYRSPSNEPLAQPSDIDPKFGLTLPFAEVGRYGIVTLCASWILLIGLWGSSFSAVVTHPEKRAEQLDEREVLQNSPVSPLAGDSTEPPSAEAPKPKRESPAFVLEAAPPVKRR